ncbi:cytochrome P450 CYP82D47-like [Aristolochia californica]|uniref:cytochrome P450 CYP82D47-like n=1 Tax=Aristolochia californica TaxID=171875 RepID=UPI0035DBB5BC
MEILLVLQVILGFLALYLFSGLFRSFYKRHQGPPEVSGWRPIIGHLHLIGGNRLPHRTLGALADTYGPLFTLWIGLQRAVVVSSWKHAKECLTTNDKVLANRPPLTAGKYLGYNFSVLGFAKYGPYWREVRKIATLELLSTHRLELLKHVRVNEIDLSIKDLYRKWAKKGTNAPLKVEMKQWFWDLTFNNIVMTIAGKRYFGTNGVGDDKVEEKCREVMDQFFYLTGIFVLSEAVPFLEMLDVGGHIRAMKKTAKELDALVSVWVEEHRQRRISGVYNGDQDFIDVMLSIQEKSPIPGCDPDTAIKATSLTFVLAGTDTTSLTLTWAIALLLNNRSALKKAQEELDVVVGKERNVEESDIKNLPYLQAIAKEAMRLYPAAPLSGPHLAMGDCKIAGYHVPEGTRVILNLWKLQRDPEVWSNPLAFQPERFLTNNAHLDVRGQHFELIPFGSGRRMCPAISFALQVMHLTIARLLHGFDLQTVGDEPVDLTEGMGVTIPKETPLEVLITPRLPASLY